VHLADALFPGSAPPVALAVCDRHAGSDTPIRKSLARRAAGARSGRPLSGVTTDREDGPTAGREAEQARMVVNLPHSAGSRFSRPGARNHDSALAAFSPPERPRG